MRHFTFVCALAFVCVCEESYHTPTTCERTIHIAETMECLGSSSRGSNWRLRLVEAQRFAATKKKVICTRFSGNGPFHRLQGWQSDGQSSDERREARDAAGVSLARAKRVGVNPNAEARDEIYYHDASGRNLKIQALAGQHLNTQQERNDKKEQPRPCGFRLFLQITILRP